MSLTLTDLIHLVDPSIEPWDNSTWEDFWCRKNKRSQPVTSDTNVVQIFITIKEDLYICSRYIYQSLSLKYFVSPEKTQISILPYNTNTGVIWNWFNQNAWVLWVDNQHPNNAECFLKSLKNDRSKSNI